MADNTTTFANASIQHIILETYKMVTPVAELPDGKNFLVYVQGDESAEFYEIPAETMESYTGANKVDLANLNSDSIAQYQLGAARQAMAVLPEDKQIGVVNMGYDIVMVDADGHEGAPDELPAGNMDIVDVQRQISGKFDASTADDLLKGGDLVEAVRLFRLEANNTPGGNFDLKGIDAAYQVAEIALNLPGYRQELIQAVQQGAVEHGITDLQVENIIDMIENGVPESPVQAITPNQ